VLTPQRVSTADRRRFCAGRLRRTGDASVRLRAVVSTVVPAAALAILTAPAYVACEADPVPCKVDTDCPEGDLCRDERCGPTSTDGGTADAAACAPEGTLCTRIEECCSRVCDNGRCATAASSGSTSGGPPCVDAYGLCSGSECCAGLTCTSGTCR
jgi:Cys-rich repeat protein